MSKHDPALGQVQNDGFHPEGLYPEGLRLAVDPVNGGLVEVPGLLLKPMPKRGRRDEGDGWANWSGLATQLANMEKAFAGKVNLVLLTLRLHQPHQDAERSTAEVVR